MAIDRPNQVWCAYITYIPAPRGFLYLVAIMDGAMRHVLAWLLLKTMDADICVKALEETLTRYGKPRILTQPGQPVYLPQLYRKEKRCRYLRLYVWQGPVWRSLKCEAA